MWSVVEVVGLGVASCDGFGGRGGQKMQKQKQGLKTRQTVSSFFFWWETLRKPILRIILKTSFSVVFRTIFKMLTKQA